MVYFYMGGSLHGAAHMILTKLFVFCGTNSSCKAEIWTSIW